MFDLTPIEISAAAGAALIVGFGKSGIPGILILGPILMASVFPAKESTGILLPILVVGDLAALTFYRRHAQWRMVARILPYTMVGIVAGFLFLGTIDDRQMQLFLSIIVLLIVVLMILKEVGLFREEAVPRTTLIAIILGFLAGFVSMAANAAGPVMTAYLIAMNLEKKEFLGSYAWFFFLLNVIKLPFSASLGLISGQSLLFDLKLVPLVLLGAGTGYLTVRRMSARVFRFLMLALALFATVRMFM